MICPHCNYEYGSIWNGENYIEAEGKQGDFYKLPVMLEKAEKYSYQVDRVNLYACPCCKKTFIED